jgi:nucleotide-binding universal stress UspA family protein
MMTGFQRILIASHTSAPDPGLRRIAERFRAADGTTQTFHAALQDEDDTLDAIVAEAIEQRADLLVLGARTHVLASRAAMVAPCSILMAPDGVEFDARRILIPVDFSDHSRDALRTGAALAGDGEAICVFIESEDAPWHARRDEAVEHAHKLEALDSFVRSVLGSLSSVRCLAEPLERSNAVLGDAGFSLPRAIEGADIASTIERVAQRENADLIVLGTRGRSRSASILLGSVTEKLMQFSRRPVLAVKRRGSNLGLLDLLMGKARVHVPA